jgi:hypothetical protein
MPRRVQQPSTPVVPRPADPRTPTTPTSTSTSWGTSTATKVKKPVLGSIEGALIPTPTKALEPAKVATSIAGVPVRSATTSQFTGLTGAKELMTRTVDVSFGKLSRPQFDALKAEFGNKSSVPFDANREYTAVDFLPPALQGLVNRDLDTGHNVSIPGTKKLAEHMMMGELVEIGSTPNCHGTAWEMMRAYLGGASTHVQLAYGDAQLATDHYSDKFTTLASAKPGEKLDTSKLQPGDVVSFARHDKEFGDMELLHSAVYVGGGLYFEKPDTESDQYSETPYRLVTLDQVTAPIAEFLSEQPSVTARRPKAALAPPSEAFGSASDETGKLEALLNKRGETIGKQLTTELIVGMGGGIRGMAFNAIVTKRVEIDATGRGAIR